MKDRAEPVIPIRRLEDEFKSAAVLAERFIAELVRQIQELLETNSISLSFPVQQRVKAWASLREKLERKALVLESLKDLDDLVGLRLILQFTRDVPKVCGLIQNNFKVLKNYDTSDRLKTDQFGYSSTHLVVELPETWLAVPTFSQMKGWRAEIQVRTTAQHIWATASHTLQYKQEGSVPDSVRRAIFRVSALLEMVDLEFERLLGARDTYRGEAGRLPPNSTLNVDLLENLLDSLLPELNKDREEKEPYAELLRDLNHFKITDRGGLAKLIEEHLPAALLEDERQVASLSESPDEISEVSTPSRLELGVFYTHIGLIRECLQQAFGEAWKSYNTYTNSRG